MKNRKIDLTTLTFEDYPPCLGCGHLRCCCEPSCYEPYKVVESDLGHGKSWVCYHMYEAFENIYKGELIFSIRLCKWTLSIVDWGDFEPRIVHRIDV